MSICRTIIASTLALLMSSHLKAQDTVPETAEVQSDRLAVLHAERRARFEGHVRAKYGHLTLHCDEMVVLYDTSGNITSLHAQGNVTVLSKENRALATSAKLNVQRQVLVLEGNCSLERGPHRLEGSRIDIFLLTGKLDIADARGSFKIDLKNGPQ
ncbi:MAG: LptA/OstA family protein [Myxococcota bacterium]|nr:LptA/OstA family protein [Myxococcota bacterium]